MKISVTHTHKITFIKQLQNSYLTVLQNILSTNERGDYKSQLLFKTQGSSFP